jgi:hypothetical protein
MLGIGCPDRYALPHITPDENTLTMDWLPSRASGFVQRPFADIRIQILRCGPDGPRW